MVVIWNTALTVAGFVSYRRLSRRVGSIPVNESDIYTRYMPPVEDYTEPFTPALDTAGSWAAEMAMTGVRITDEEIASQRRMRLAEGL